MFSFFRNMHLIKINLCAEVAAFFHSMEKISSAIVGTWMLNLPQVYLFIFYFWLRNGKNYKIYFSSRKELENLFLKNYFWMRKLQHWNLWHQLQKIFFPPRRSMKNYKKYFCLWMRKLQYLNLCGCCEGKIYKNLFPLEWMENIIKSIFCLYVILFFLQHAFNKN